MKKVMVTGSHGFIGQNMTKFLEDRNVEVVPVDKKIGIDILDLKNEYFEDLDGIVHLAAISGLKNCSDDPIQAVRDNCEATLFLFSISREKSIPLVFSSSGAAQNGISDNADYFISEQIINLFKLTKLTPEDVKNLYGYTKHYCENVVKNFPKTFSNVRILRFSNVWDISEYYLKNKNTAVANFIRSYLSDNIFEINGFGTQKRDFIHVSDVCLAIWKALTWRGSISVPVDIGTGIYTSIVELAGYFRTEHFKVKHNFKSDMIGAAASKADTKLAKSLFGFEHTIEIKNIKSFVDTTFI
ncbi:MAG: NAD-dependent epimerase/dehydratase family protein [Atribacterota bacterium]